MDTFEKRQELIKRLEEKGLFAYDSETTDIDANKAEMVGMSFSTEAYEGYYVPIPAKLADAQAILNEFRPLLENPNIKKIGQNIKYDLIILKWYGIEMQGVEFDTMIAHYLLEPELRHNMNYMSETYLHYAPFRLKL